MKTSIALLSLALLSVSVIASAQDAAKPATGAKATAKPAHHLWHHAAKAKPAAKTAKSDAAAPAKTN